MAPPVAPPFNVTVVPAHTGPDGVAVAADPTGVTETVTGADVFVQPVPGSVAVTVYAVFVVGLTAYQLHQAMNLDSSSSYTMMYYW